MLVVRCRNPNSAERELIDAIKELDGITFIGYTVSQGEREREIDALIFTPVRAVAVEVKAPMLATPREGELVPFANAPWTIGGERAQFYGGPNPNAQAKLGAQIFAQFLRECMDKTPFVQVAVSIADAELVMSRGPLMVGQTAVSLTSRILDSLEQMKKKPITLNMVLEIIEVMDLDVLKPSREEIENEWRNSDELQQDLFVSPEPNRSEKDPVGTPKRTLDRQDKPLFFAYMEKFSDGLKSATVIFLFIWFLYTIGVLNATIELFDALQDIVTQAATQNDQSSG